MTTYDYEVLGIDVAATAAQIRDRDRRESRKEWRLSSEELGAMLGWAQHEQDHVVYERCYEEMLRREDFGDPDAVPCCDCGVLLPLSAEAYAIDCGGICAACARARYGENASEYRIA